MSDDIKLVQQSLDLIASGPAEAWAGKIAEDVVIRFPFAPPPVNRELRSYQAALDALSAHWQSMQGFAWRDVVTVATSDPELFLTTAKSSAATVTGYQYANSYVILVRVRGGKVVSYDEYFDPAPVVEMMQSFAEAAA